MKRIAIAGTCAALALTGIMAPSATAARPVPPHISSVTFEWLGLGNDGSCHSTMTVTLDPGYTKGKPVMLTKAWLVDGVPENETYFSQALPGETTFSEEMAYNYPQDWPYEGIVMSLRSRGGRLVEDPYVLAFAAPYYCR